MEEKQQRVSKYETLQICSALLPNSNNGSNNVASAGAGPGAVNSDGAGSNSAVAGNDSESSDMGPCVMCVARRISFDEKRIGLFNLKLDTTGKIIAVDTGTSWLPDSYSKYLSNKVISF